MPPSAGAHEPAPQLAQRFPQDGSCSNHHLLNARHLPHTNLQETRLGDPAVASGRQPVRSVKFVTPPPKFFLGITVPRPAAHPHANPGALAVGSLHFASVACTWRSK